MKNTIQDNHGRIIATTEILVNGILPHKLFDFMLSLNKKKFIDWHPDDHKDFRIIRQSPKIKGNIFYFNELIGGKYEIAHTWQIIDFRKDEMILMKAKIFVPVYLKLIFTGENRNTLVTHRLRIGFRWLAYLNRRIAKNTFSTDRQRVSDQHAKEEFKNLETLL